MGAGSTQPLRKQADLLRYHTGKLMLQHSQRHYIEQDRVRLEHWRRQPTGDWAAQTYTTLDAIIVLPTLGVTLPLREVSRQVFDS